jgi:hypothetical protein
LARQIQTFAERQAIDRQRRKLAEEAAAQAQAQAATTGQTAMLAPIEMPSDYIPKPIEGTQEAPTYPEYMSDPAAAVDKALGETGNLEALRGDTKSVFDPVTGQYVSTDTSEGQSILDGLNEAELSAQQGRERTLKPETPEAEPTLAFETPQQFIEKPEIQTFLKTFGESRENEIEELALLGSQLRGKLQETIIPTMQDTSDAAMDARIALTESGVYDNETRVLDPTLANAFATSAILAGYDMMTRENENITNRKKVTQPEGQVIQTTAGTFFSPDAFRNRLAPEAMNLIGSNPNQLAPDVRTGFGGFGDRMSPQAKGVLNGVFHNALSDLGWFEYTWLDVAPENRTPENAYIRLSGKGAEAVRRLIPLLKDMNLVPEVDVSYAPTIGGTTLPGVARDAGLRYAGNISATNKYDKNTAKSDKTKTILGSVAHRVVTDRFLFAKMMVEGLIGRDRDGRIFFKHPPADGFFYSDHVAREGQRNFGFAETLGVSKEKWYQYFDHAKKTMPDDQAIAQANMIMRQQARKILRIIEQGDTNSNRVFYNKVMHSTSVNRFFTRNTVLNTQNDKLARMFVGNAEKIIINPKKDRSSKLFENWSYIIGYNLLDGAVASEDRGWTSISNEVKRIISNPNSPIYRKWVDKGRQIVQMLDYIRESQDPVKRQEMLQRAQEIGEDVSYGVDALGMLFEQDPKYRELLSEFSKQGEWGYPYQSYIDMYRYDQALKSSSDTATFQTFAQVQHDGKQNGIAQQAMQSGKRKHLTRVGAIYGDDENVISEGDIRGLFFDNFANNAIDAALSKRPERVQYWKDIVDRINNHPRRREILKALSKSPLMETSYGRNKMFNRETAAYIIDTTEFDDSKSTLVHSIDGYSREDKIADLNLVIAESLDLTLDFELQNLYKQIGKSWAMLGPIIPEMLGPAGNLMYFGSNEAFQVGKITLQLPRGPVEIPITGTRSTGSARQRNRKLIQKPDELKYTLQEQTPYGQETANQLPVLPIQQIDAAIMAETILAVNEARIANNRGPLFVIPVHDAIITDASSVSDYHSEINNKFVEVNKRYSVSKAIYNGFNTQYKEALDSISDSKTYALGDDSPYRALHSYLLQVYNEERTGVSTYEDEAGNKQELLSESNPKYKEIYKIITSTNSGWNPDGTGFVNGKLLKQLLKLAIQPEKLNSRLTALHDRAEQSKKFVFGELAKMIYQYN